MGRDIETTDFTRDDRLQFREKVKADLAALRTLVDSGSFETGRRTCGVEMEVYITDADGSPVPLNAQLLERMASADFQTELAQFTIEFDVKPRLLTGYVFHTIDTELRRSLNHAHDVAEDLDAQVMIIGILPTLRDLDATEEFMSANERYRALNNMILNARGEDILIKIEGTEVVEAKSRSILFEAACTSMQLHLQVDPHDFGLYWNAAQVLSAPLVAVGANSPFFLGKQAPSRDSDRAVRTGHRHAHRGAGAAGRAPTGVVRREVARRGRGSMGPVRRERPLLPRPAAHLRRRGPGSDDRGGCGAHVARADAAQRNDLPVEPSGVRGRAGPSAHEDREPCAAGRTVGPGLRRQRRLLLRAAPRSRLPGRGRTSGSR